jgi:hypothetical protein
MTTLYNYNEILYGTIQYLKMYFALTAIQLGVVVNSLKTEGSIPTVASTNPFNYYMEQSTPSKAEAVKKFTSSYGI